MIGLEYLVDANNGLHLGSASIVPKCFSPPPSLYKNSSSMLLVLWQALLAYSIGLDTELKVPLVTKKNS